MDKQIKRSLLRPLSRRRRLATDRKAIAAALERLDTRAMGEHILSQMAESISAIRNELRSRSWKDPAAVGQFVKLAQALYASRRISNQEYVFFAASPIESIHESRWFDGEYDAELREIAHAMEVIEQNHGLDPDHHWSIGQGPDDYERLSKQYDSVLDEKFSGALREFGVDDLADLKRRDPDKFDRHRERGRRSLFHKDEVALAVRDIVVRYEDDARRAAAAQAYSAAITLLGAGLEGLLLLRCLKSKQKSLRIANILPKRERPRSPRDPTTWNFQTLIEVCLKAGWFASLSTSIAQYDPAGLAHAVRRMRNYVHPGKYARERPWVEVDEREYKDAEAIYVALRSAIID